MTPATGEGSKGRASLPHGTRGRYRQGCRCMPCRAASAADRQARRSAQAWPIVEADAAREYLLTLQRRGIGAPQAAKLAGVSEHEIRAIRSGERRRIRRTTADRVLAVRPVLAFGQRVPSWPTRRLLQVLLREGYTRRELAQRLGLNRLPLSRHDEHTTVETALRVQAFYRRVTADGPDEDDCAPTGGEEAASV